MKKFYYYTLEGMDGQVKLTCATKGLAKMFMSQCGNEGICYKRNSKDPEYKKFVFMW